MASGTWFGVMPPTKSGIYAIHNNINGKVYIGRAVCLSHRWSAHKRYLNKGSHTNPHLQRAWLQYGAENFRFEVLELEPQIENLHVLEHHYIVKYNALDPDFGYNLNIVTENSYKASPETRKKQSDAQKARHKSNPPQKRTPEQIQRMCDAQAARKHKASPETKAKQSLAGKGRRKTEAHRLAIGLANKGRIVTEETREKISLGNLGKTHTEETKRQFSETRKGRIVSAETRQKISEALKVYHTNREEK